MLYLRSWKFSNSTTRKRGEFAHSTESSLSVSSTRSCFKEYFEFFEWWHREIKFSFCRGYFCDISTFFFIKHSKAMRNLLVFSYIQENDMLRFMSIHTGWREVIIVKYFFLDRVYFPILIWKCKHRMRY